MSTNGLLPSEAKRLADCIRDADEIIGQRHRLGGKQVEEVVTWRERIANRLWPEDAGEICDGFAEWFAVHGTHIRACRAENQRRQEMQEQDAAAQLAKRQEHERNVKLYGIDGAAKKEGRL